MGNITLTVDDNTVKRVRKIALERDTTLTAMVRDYLEQVASSDKSMNLQRAIDLEHTFANLSANLKGKDWKREDLYEC